MIKKYAVLFSIFLCLPCFGFNFTFSKTANAWAVLRQQFALGHETLRPEVKEQLRWLSAHPHYIQKIAEQSEPYLYFIISEIKKRKLPGELAILPMIESAYNPFAYSPAGAAGLWQLMPGTGSGLGLKQDWWYDGRRSISLSTQAALKYLSYLNRYFKGNWILAIAAYDSGQGKILKAMQSNKQYQRKINFWSLNLPLETKKYIPRLLAIAEIIKNPERYHIKLPDFPYEPYFEEVDIKGQIDLNQAAQMANMSYEQLIRLNPGYNRWVTAPYEPYHLLLPVNKKPIFVNKLKRLPEEERVNWVRHQVQKGETLSHIALRYHTTVGLIKKINNIESTPLTTKQKILIPGNNLTTVPVNPKKINQIDNSTNSKYRRVIHIVQKNDNYLSISKLYNVSPGQIRFWNNLASANKIPVGKQLIIWKRIASPAGIYIVKKNDTLGQIAKTYQLSLNEIIKLNPDLNSRIIKPGQKIKLAFSAGNIKA